MKSFSYTIRDEIGIHARPAGLLVQEAKKYSSVCTLLFGEKTADLKHVLALLSLCVCHGSGITVTADGADETEAIAGLKKVLEENL